MQRKLPRFLTQLPAAVSEWSRSARHRRQARIAGLALAAVLLVWLLLPSRGGLPDFRDYQAGPERKGAFLAYLLPFVEEANAGILDSRERIVALQEKWQERGKLGRGDLKWLTVQAGKCGLEVSEAAEIDETLFTTLLNRVDIIPPSLALSQAALESGWGTSRFARKANNLFGIFCHKPGCGLVPEKRAAGVTHEVKRYDSPRESFEDYIWNLNRHPAYRDLRQIRQDARVQNRPILGVELALGLARYSQRGTDYVSDVTKLIRTNDLTDYDRVPAG